MAGYYDTEVENQRKTGKVTNVALPILAALEAIGTSIATKGRNPTSNALGIYKDVQSGREAALERALGRDKATADAARQDKLLGFQEAEEGRRKSEYEREGKTRTAETDRIGAIKRKLLGSPATLDSLGVETAPAVPGVADLTDIDKAAIDADPIGWLTNKLKPQSVNVLAGDGGFFTMPKAGGVATPVKTGEGTTVKPPPKPVASDKPPAAPKGYRYTADGGMEYIPGGPADPKNKVDAKPATEDQSKAATFARRMELAMSDLEKITKSGYDPTSAASAVRSAKFTPNFLNSSKGQSWENAQKNFVRANLRKESGAVIGPQEMADEIKVYFPQHGDSPDVIDQKERLRAQAFEGMKAAAGAQFDKIPSMIPAPADPLKPLAQQALNDPEATEQEKAAARKILGIK